MWGGGTGMTRFRFTLSIGGSLYTLLSLILFFSSFTHNIHLFIRPSVHPRFSVYAGLLASHQYTRSHSCLGEFMGPSA